MKVRQYGIARLTQSGAVAAVALLALCCAAQGQTQVQLQKRVEIKPAEPDKKTLSSGQVANLQRAGTFSSAPLRTKVPIPRNPSYEKTVDGHKVKTTLMLSPLHNAMRQGAGSKGGVQRKEEPPTYKDGLVCRNATVRVSLDDDSFKSVSQSGQATRLLPGLVYDFDSFFSGRMAPSAAPRHPVRLSLPNVTGMAAPGGGLARAGGGGPASYIDVDQPDMSTLNEAALQLRNRLPPKSGNKQSASMDIQELHSGAEALLALSGSAAAYGVKVSAAYESNSAREERQILVDATQEMFTISAMPSSEGIFVNPEDARKGDKIMLGNVTYGHRVLLAIKTQTRSESEFASATASYSNFVAKAEASAKAGSRTFSGSSSIRMYDVGNISKAAPTSIEQVDGWLKAYFASANMENAQPIRYQFVNMNNELVRSESATDNVPVNNCVQDDMTLKVTLEQIRNVNAREHQSMPDAGKSVSGGNRNEVVKFGTRQTVNAVVGGREIFDLRGRPHHSICWWDQGNADCGPAREFNGQVDVNKADTERAFPIKASQVRESDHVNIHTAYIAMYRTKAGGSTNGKQNPQPADKVYINDVIAAGGAGKPWYVQVPWNGRLFEYRYRLVAE
ncbi:MAG: hypothetical protein J0H52_03520 [Comamonadaceae bacterium]|nr:hypothetical protein [Comamonadaceae bacterium]MBN9368474.1 hypothetical protein [Comamonadaceae bacterium]UJB64785.1 hypothetical protein YS110_08530 [Acidovorax sp. YS12]